MLKVKKIMLGLWMCLVTLLVGFASAAQAETSDWQGIDKAQVRLVSASSHIGSSKNVQMGLQFKMEKNWKVYWRTPGDAGFPPDLDWEGSQNLSSAVMKWPVPERFEVLGLETVGYKDKVVFPLDVVVQDSAHPLSANVHVRFLTCDDVCIPVDVTLNMTLPAGVAEVTQHAQLINQYNSQVPQAADKAGYELTSATLFEQADGKTGVVRLDVTGPNAFAQFDALLEGPEEFAFFKPSFQVHESGNRLLIDVPMDGLQFIEGDYSNSPFTLTLIDGLRSVEATTTVQSVSGPLPVVAGFNPPDAQSMNEEGLGLILLFAVLGGLILNLMPCVLPVLSLKVLGLVSHGGGDKGAVRLSFLASSAGILFSFWLLAAFLVALKSAGGSIGWGIQFQEPLFLIALTGMIVLFALNMWGVFEINLPGWMSLVGATKSKGLGGHFLTGAFATLLATPCSAPFLGTAVGFALARGASDIFLVFSALGVGLALPYLLIALFPKTATLLPKPGNWMITLRKVLAVLLVATALWLLSILAVQISPTAAIMLGVIMALIAVVFVVKSLRPRALPLVVVLMVGAFTLPSVMQADSIADTQVEELWVPFDEAQIAREVMNNKVVFVDVTAKWCITCQVNKKLVMYDAAVFEELSSDGLVAMKADWTNPDPVISAFLARYEKFAIPFNVVYGPGAPNGIILPEILTKDSVFDALKVAKG